MAVTWTSRNFNNVTGSVSNAVTLPASSAAGDVICIHLSWDTSGGAFTSVVPNDAQIATAQTFTGWEQRCYYRVLTAGDITGGSVTATWAAGTYSDLEVSRLTGVDTTTPIPSGGATGNSGTGTTSTGLGCNASRSGSLLFHMIVSSVGARTSGPAGMTNRYTDDTNQYGDTEAVSSNTGDRTSTYPTSQSWVVHMAVFQPPATPGGVIIVPQLRIPQSILAR
jgi:hypothetical protein